MKKTHDNKKKEQKQRKRPSPHVVKTAVLGTVLGVCASAIVGLSVALYYAQTSIATHETYQRQMDAVYSRAYYDLLDGASDLGITLRKIGISGSQKMQQSLLYEVWNTAQLAEDSLGMFQSDDDGMLKAQKFVNQLGDYSHSLALHIANGGSLGADDRQKLFKLGEMADMYSKALQGMQEYLRDGRTFLDDGALDNFTSAFSSFSEPSFEYPEMIYDGPFSSALENRETLGLTGDVIDRAQGEKMLRKYFSSYYIKDVSFVGESSADIETLDYTVNCDGEDCYVQLAKRGGMLISFNGNFGEDMSVANVEASRTCQQSALAFAKNAGFDNMCVVWSSSADGECVVNLAPQQDGVILYPDLIKVKLRERDSRVVGFDSSHYAFNHTQRQLVAPSIDERTASKALSLPAISEGRLALIPIRESKEVLAYEFECRDDGTYFVYIDAMTGDEANILYVIEDESGTRTI